MDIFEYCLACLVTDVKMIKFSPNVMSSTIGEEILHFLRSPLKEDGSNYFCFECAAFLYKSEKFRSKCERAQAVLLRLKEEKNQLTKKTLQNINRNQFILTSNLAVNVIETTSLINGYNNAEDTTFDIKPNTEYNVEENPIKNEFQQETLDHENYNLDTLNAESTEESFNHKSKLKKTNKKDFKTKKRKPPESSDDEPLINKVTKKLNVEKKPRKSFNISYFEDYATVDFLSLDDAKKEMLLRKESSNYINSAFKCDFCYRGFEAKGTFDNHMKKHSSDYGEFVCDICHLRFQEQRCLCKHKLASHKRKFTCKLCSYVCFCTHQAKTHVSLHKGKKYPCKECGEIFSMPNSLLMHKRLKHQTECVCDMCGDMFATTRGLYSHRVKVHRQDKNVKNGPKCEDCNIHFANEASWKRHLVLASKHNVR